MPVAFDIDSLRDSARKSLAEKKTVTVDAVELLALLDYVDVLIDEVVRLYVEACNRDVQAL